MADKKKPRGKPFCKGFDPRRHPLTRQERAKGYAAAPSRIRSRIRSLYRGYDGVSKMKKKPVSMTEAEDDALRDDWTPDDMPF